MAEPAETHPGFKSAPGEQIDHAWLSQEGGKLPHEARPFMECCLVACPERFYWAANTTTFFLPTGWLKVIGTRLGGAVTGPVSADHRGVMSRDFIKMPFAQCPNHEVPEVPAVQADNVIPITEARRR